MVEPPITLVMAYYNEEEVIRSTLASLVDQTERNFRLIMVDNASTDTSRETAGDFLHAHPWLDVRWLREERKGQFFALRTGIEHASTRFVGTVDADTIYPPGYVARALTMLDGDEDVAIAMAIDTPLAASRVRHFKWLQVQVWPGKCHAGGAGHVYRTSAVEAVGSFNEKIWPFVLFDHEIAHRISAHGRFAYDRAHKIAASDRRSAVAGRSWNLTERLLYKLLPRSMMDWFFYRFLGPRLARRNAYSVALRDRPWEIAKP